MANGRIAKRVAIGLVIVIGAALCVAIVALVMLQARTDALHDDWQALRDDPQYATVVHVDGVEPITQDVSCGYAVIQMFSTWDGGNITEQSLYDEYGSVVTSTGQSFCDEMNKQFPAYATTLHKYLPDSELIAKAHNCLADGIPIPIEWAAKYGDEWTLHYSLVTGMDIAGNKVTVANPYGYTEELTLDELLARTSFEAYEDMPIYLKLGFAFGIFEENAIFTVERAA